jgi:hypothetical protein
VRIELLKRGVVVMLVMVEGCNINRFLSSQVQ